jgi:hypothetical protein
MTTARLLATIALVLLPSLALAEDLNVTLTDNRGRAVDGQVTATPSAGGTALRCTTRGGRCTIHVSAGTYSVRATLLSGGSIPAKNVTVRSGATASVALAAPAPGTSTPTVSTTAAGTGTSPTGATQTGTGTGTTTGNLGGTTGGVGTAPVAGTQAPAGTTVPDIGTGRIARVQGNVTDARGRAIDGTVTFSRSGRAVGKCGTRAGRFVAFDLSAGTYAMAFRAASGQTGQANVTVLSAGQVTANIRAQ